MLTLSSHKLLFGGYSVYKLAASNTSSFKSNESGDDSSKNSHSAYNKKSHRVTFQEGSQSNKELQVLSESYVNGSWKSQKNSVRGVWKHFVPATVEDAKLLLRSVGSLSIEKMQRIHICHGCHSILGDGAHQGSAIGKVKCTFSHSLSCKGGIRENESWRACPEGYVYNPEAEYQFQTGFTDTLDPSVFHESQLRRSTPAGSRNSLDKEDTVVPASSQQRPPVYDNRTAQQVQEDSDLNDRLRRQAAGEGARSKSSSLSKSNNALAPPLNGDGRNPTEIDNHNYLNNERVMDRQHRGSLADLPPHIVAQIQDFRSQNQASNQVRDRPENEFNIRNLRANENLRTQVENGVQSVRERIPSLARAPSAFTQTHHRRMSPSQQENCHVNGFEWTSDPQYGRYLMPSYQSQRPHARDSIHCTDQNSLPRQINQVNERTPPQSHQDIYYHRPTNFEYRCSPSSGRTWQVEVPPRHEKSYNMSYQNPPTYRVEYRCSPTTGRVWKEQVPVSPPRKPMFHLEWRVNPHTGETYQVEVPSPNNYYQSQSQIDGQGTCSGRYVRDRQEIRDQSSLDTIGRRSENHVTQQHSVNQDRDVRQAPLNMDLTGITHLEKSKKNSRVVDLARLCPVKWAKAITSNNINLPLYTWAVVSEIESSLSGRTKQIPERELLGKIRHLKNVVEVCCLNSNSSEFTSYGWAIAKDYALKVEDEVTQGLAEWSEMAHGVRTSSLLLAQMDCPRQMFQKGTKGKDTDKEKMICTTYNKCSTKGKCDYEVANPDKSCQRKHECSWCRTNLGQSYRHQASECNKRKEAAGAGSA